MNSLSEPNWFGARLKVAREAAGLSQEELAERVSLTRLTISRYESGELKPGFERLQPLAEALSKPLAWFFQDNDAGMLLILERLDRVETLLQAVLVRLDERK